VSGGINPIHFESSMRVACSIDYEYQQIIKRLLMYGLKPSGNKSADKARLHEIELREAKKENCITTKFLTVSTQEQQKIQDKKKEKRVEVNPKLYPDSMKGQRILGEQIMLAIKMKKEKETSIDNRRKVEKKKAS